MVGVPVFMAYNLGADSTLDTPKKQMAFLATAPVSTNTNNGRVYGGRYQWGRANLPYAISSDGNYTLYDGAVNSISLEALIPASYDSNGQIIGQDNNHVYVRYSATGSGTFDWRGGESSPVRQDDLWDKNGGTKAGSLSPSKSVNDPCPSGWRAPTQDEWERLCIYDCDHTTAGGVMGLSGSVPFISDGVAETNTGFTWVAVVCSGGVCYKNADWENKGQTPSGYNSGYAVYRSDVWNDSSWDKSNLISPSAPEPFLFLPAEGCRSYGSGTVNYVGTYGYYWSSTTNGSNAYYLSFGYNRIATQANSYRDYGYAVRCVKE